MPKSESVSKVDLKLPELLIKLPSQALLGALFVYQKTRILRPPSCRFYPSCSEYTAGAVRRFGFAQGLFLGLGRLGRCHPFHEGGVDEVPHHKWTLSENLFQSRKNRPEVASEH